MNCEIQVRRSEKKTNAQKCKEYRERKKLEDHVRVPKNSAQQEIKKPKTDGERSKKYRERQKIKNLNELQHKNTDRLQSKSTMTRAEYMKEYRRKVKLKNLIIKLNALPTEDHLETKKKKMGDVQQRSQNEKGSEKSDSQSEFQASELTYKRRIKTKLRDPPRSTDGSQTSKASLLVPTQEEVKEVLPKKYLEVTVKEEVPESEDVRRSSSRAVFEGVVPGLVLIKEEVTEVLSEIYVEVTIKEEVPESEDADKDIDAQTETMNPAHDSRPFSVEILRRLLIKKSAVS